MKIRLSELRKIIKEVVSDALAPYFLVTVSSKFGPAKTHRYETREAALAGYNDIQAGLAYGQTAELKRVTADGEEETWSPSWENFPSEVLPHRR